VVLVPGACLGGWCWREVAAELRGRRLDPYPVTLTGLGERVHLASPAVDLDTHVADVVNLLDFEDLDDAVLVGHSYAGAVITGVADRRPARIGLLVYLDTLPLPAGSAIVDLQTPEQRAQQRSAVARDGDGWRWPPPDRATLASGLFGSASGLGERELERLEGRATPQPYATFTSPLELAHSLPPSPRVAIFCSHGGPSLATVRALIAAGDPRVSALAGPDWELHELPSGHWPMFSAPAQLTDLLYAIAGSGA